MSLKQCPVLLIENEGALVIGKTLLEAFDLDIVQAISDPYREASDLGLDVLWPEDSLPVRRAILLPTPEDASSLKRVAPENGRLERDGFRRPRDAVRSGASGSASANPPSSWRCSCWSPRERRS